MKKILWLLFLVGQAFSLEIKTRFERDVISLRVDFSPLDIREDGTYSVVSSDGCKDSYLSDKPNLPIRSIFLALPPNASVKDIKIVPEQARIEGEYNISLVSPPIPISETQNLKLKTQNSFIGIFPENVAFIDPIQRFRGYSLLPINVFAAQCNGKKLYWNKSVQIEITLETQKILSTPAFFRANMEDEDIIKGLVENKDILSSYKKLKTQNLELKTTSYQYIVITDQSLASSFQPLIDHKIAKGLSAKIMTTQWIYELYKGRDNQEKIRNFIIDHYTFYGTEYILLGGDVELVPYRGVYASVGNQVADSSIPCDLYFSCLDGDWDKDNDNVFGELIDDVDLMPEVYVGRAPVNTQTEAQNFVNKVISYHNSQYAGYILNELLIGWRADSYSDCADVKEDIATFTPTYYTIYKEYESKGGVSKTRIIDYINSGIGLINHAGHANESKVPPFEISDVDSLTNKDKLFIFYTLGCLPGKFEASDCIGEHFINNTEGGAVAFVGNSRYGWYQMGNAKAYSGEYDIEFFKKYFKEGYVQLGQIFHQSKVAFISRSNSDDPYRWIMFCLNLLGDPEMNVWGADTNVLKGTVKRSDTKEPIYKANVEIIQGESTGSSSTSLSGVYAIRNIKEGTYTIRATKEGCSLQEKTIYVKGLTNLDFELTPNIVYSIKGIVKTGSDVGIEGVRVDLEEDSFKTTLTDKSGRYEFSSILSGNYIIKPNKENFRFAPGSRTYTNLSSSYENQDFTSINNIYRLFPPYGPVNTRIELLGNGFWHNEQISIDFGDTKNIAFSNTDSIGQFQCYFNVDSQPLGTKVITLRGISSSLVNTTIFCIVAPFYITGYTKDASGNVIKGAKVILSQDKNAECITNENGYYEFLGLGVGSYTVYVAGNEFSPLSRTYSYILQSYTNQNFYKKELAFHPAGIFRYNIHRTGKSPYKACEYPAIKWTYGYPYSGGGTPEAPAIGYDGTIYVGDIAIADLRTSVGLHAISPTGTLKWKVSGFLVEPAPSIGQDGTIYFVGTRYEQEINSYRPYIIAVWPDGVIRWQIPIGSRCGDNAHSSPVISSSGRIYVGGADGLYAISQDGVVEWKCTLPVSTRMCGSPAISPNGDIYIAPYINNTLYCISQEGQIKWTFYFSTLVFNCTPVVGKDGTIYMGDYWLYAISPDGKMKWKYFLGLAGLDSSPAISDDDTIYVASGDHLFAINPDGSLKWESEKITPSPNYRNYSSPVVDQSGRIYVGAIMQGLVEGKNTEGGLYCFNPDGKVNWNLGFCDSPLTPVISQEGVIYFTCGGMLYAIDMIDKVSIYGSIKTISVLSDERIVENVVLTLSGPITTSTTTGRNGSFIFKDIPFGTYTLIPRKTGFAFEPSSRTYIPLWKNEQNQDFQIKYPPLYIISGTIKKNSGQALNNITVFLSGFKEATTTTNAQGFYSFIEIPSGTYSVSPNDNGFLFLPEKRLYSNIGSSQDDADFTAYSKEEPIWGEFMRDCHHSGASPYSGPFLPKTSWTYKGSPTYSSPVVGADGAIYLVDNNNLLVFNPSGSIKWSLSGTISSSPGIGKDGTIYIGIDKVYLWALDPSGSIKWKCRLEANDYNQVHSGPLIYEDKIYVLTKRNLHCLNLAGSVTWTFSPSGWATTDSFAIGRDGTIYLANLLYGLYALNPDGSLKWKISNLGITSYLTIGPDGTIYGCAGRLYAISDLGNTYTIKWTGNVSGNPVVDPMSGKIYVVQGGELFRLSPINGSIEWELDIGDTSYATPSPPTIDKNGTIYAGSSKFYAITPNGKILWKYYINTGWCGRVFPPVIADKRLYILAGDSRYMYLTTLESLPLPLKIEITPGSLTIPIRELATLTVKVYDGEGNQLTASDIGIYWRVTMGVIGGFYPGGSADMIDYFSLYEFGIGSISVHPFGSEIYFGSITVTIIPNEVYFDRIEIKPNNISLQNGKTATFSAICFDRYDNKITDLAFEWSINKDIGTVNPAIGSQTIFTARSPLAIGKTSGKVEVKYRWISAYADVIVFSPICKTSDKKYIFPRDKISYTISYLNPIGTTASLRVYDYLPDELQFSVSTPSYSGTGSDQNGKYYFWDISNLNQWQSGSIVIIATASTSPSFYGTLTNTAVLLCGTDTSAIATVATYLSPPSTITGTVIEVSSKKAIPGALVEAFQGSELMSSGVTDANGSYTISSLIPGTYTLFVKATGYYGSYSSMITTEAFMRAKADFCLSPASVIYVDDDNTGIELGTFHQPYRSIAKGVWSCPIKGTVSVASGTYYEDNILITKEIYIIGRGKDFATITVKRLGGSLLSFGHDGADNALLTGFTIKGDGYSIWTGITCYYKADPIIVNNRITGNFEGIYCTKASPIIANNEIVKNKINGISLSDCASPVIINNTIVANNGNAIYYSSSASPTIINNIITGNNYGIYNEGGGSLTANCNCVWSNSLGNYYQCSQGINDIQEDPYFIGSSNYRLKAGSTCIDKGTNTLPLILSTDSDGNSRIVDGDNDGIAIVDMGAYEFQGEAPRIKLTKMVNKPHILPKGTITYTITYKNEGEGTATDITIIEVLPEKVKLEIGNWKLEDVKISYWVDGKWQEEFNENATKLRWLIPEVTPGQEGSFSFVVKVR